MPVHLSAISHIGFGGRVLVLIIPVPVSCSALERMRERESNKLSDRYTNCPSGHCLTP